MPRSPMSPTRPASLRKRQSQQIIELESRLESVMAENRSLQQGQTWGHGAGERSLGEDGQTRDLQLQQKDMEIANMKTMLENLQAEHSRLNDHNEELRGANNNLAGDTNRRYAELQTAHTDVHQRWQESSRELDDLRDRHEHLNNAMDNTIEEEVAAAVATKNAEIRDLREQLDQATEQIRSLQSQILDIKEDGIMGVRDDAFFESACQQLCQHVRQWVMRFSKFSDNHRCRQLGELRDDELENRVDNTILDGSDVDVYLGDRVQRRDIFMSMAMTMIWEFVFTRYLFGMDRDQRQKLKSLEKQLAEVGSPKAIAQWRASTLTLLARRNAFVSQRTQDTEAVVQAIYKNLATLLPPPNNLSSQIQDSLRNVIKLAVDLSIEMRTQRSEYVMMPPLNPKYDTNGDLMDTYKFDAGVMNERSGEYSSNEDLAAQGATVRLVLFPLVVVKKGDEESVPGEDFVICPAQVLVSRPGKGRKTRGKSNAYSTAHSNRSAGSVKSMMPSPMDMAMGDAQ